MKDSEQEVMTVESSLKDRKASEWKISLARKRRNFGQEKERGGAMPSCEEQVRATVDRDFHTRRDRLLQ
jgi:hypothetical protein